MWEDGLRVPFLARWPGRILASRVTDEFLTSLELFPTLLSAAGATPDVGLKLDGFDMTAVLAGRAKSSRQEMFSERRDDRAASVGSWKWIESDRGGGLFDLANDLGEQHDLSAQHLERAAQIMARFPLGSTRWTPPSRADRFGIIDGRNSSPHTVPR